MNFLVTVVLPLIVLNLVEKGPDPEDVKPGWLGFGVFLALAAAVALLGFSLSKHLKRVNFDEADDSQADDKAHDKAHDSGADGDPDAPREQDDES